jgi:hypothetical protein
MIHLLLVALFCPAFNEVYLAEKGKEPFVMAKEL